MITEPRDFSNNTDEENITLLYDEQSSEDFKNQIIAYIMDKYKNLVRSLAKTMYIIGGDNDDLIQEGMIGLFKAIKDYDSGRDASFFTFAKLCIQRQMYTAVEASGRKKHMPLNTYISFQSNSDEDGVEIEDTLPDSRENTDPEAILIAQENVDDIEKAIEENLSHFEKAVLDLHIVGMNYTEIAKILKRDAKSVDNALQRIKSKLRKQLQ